ncbi:hypothetical protein V2J09_009459 [Rumex salicifolius]
MTGLNRRGKLKTCCVLVRLSVIMGHRHGFKEPQTFETNHDQFWNHIHPEDPLVHLAGASSGVVENNSFLHPVGNLQTDELRCVSHWNPPPRLNEMSSSQISHVPLNQSDVLSMHDSFHSSTAVGTLQVPGNHVHHAPSPNYIAENNAFDLTVGTNGRGQYKRKSPMIPSINETGSTSGYYCPGSSSHGSYVRQNIDAQHSRWDPLVMPPSYSPSVSGESSHRNVRSRSTFELDPDLLSTHRGPNFPSHMGSSRHLTENCNPGELSNQSPTLPLLERNHIHISSSSHGRTIYADSGNINQDANHFIIGSSTPNIPGQIAGYNHDPGSSRNPAVVQRFHSTSAQTRGVRTSYPQRSVPTNRVGIPGFQLGQAALLEEGLRSLETENYSNRYPRAHTSAGWRSNDRVRSRSFARSSHDQMTREALIAIGRSSFHGPRGMLDQQRELMLDVDNMSYEELLALGERIGSVSTGLSDDQLLKCLKETVYLTSEQVTMEERCVICLEEYQDMDQLGSLKSCSHEYHVGCIKKWLSMKNLCPICKAPALPDDMKKEKMKAPI